MGFERPLLTPADFTDATLRVAASDASYQLMRALGAEPVDPPDFSAAAIGGEVDGADSAFAWG